MAYPPIPRDANGVPIPVVWDDSINNWKVYKGPLEGIVEEGTDLE